MLEFFKENLATIAISALILLCVVLAILKILRDKKKSPCGSNCPGCMGCPPSRKLQAAEEIVRQQTPQPFKERQESLFYRSSCRLR